MLQSEFDFSIFEKQPVNAEWVLYLDAVRGKLSLTKFDAVMQSLVEQRISARSATMDLYSRLGYYLLSKNRHLKRALAHFERDAVSRQQSWFFQLRHCECWAALGNLKQAHERVEQVYAQSPQAVNGFASIAWHLKDNQGLMPNPYDYARYDINHKRISPGYMLNVAVLAMSAGERDDAKNLVEQAYRLDSNLRDGYFRCAWPVFGPFNNMAELATWLEKDHALQRLLPESQVQYAVALASLGRNKDAVRCIELAYSESSVLEDGYARCAWQGYWEKRDYPKLLEGMEKDLTLGRLSASWKVRLARVYANVRETEKAAHLLLADRDGVGSGDIVVEVAYLSSKDTHLSAELIQLMFWGMQQGKLSRKSCSYVWSMLADYTHPCHGRIPAEIESSIVKKRAGTSDGKQVIHLISNGNDEQVPLVVGMYKSFTCRSFCKCEIVFHFITDGINARSESLLRDAGIEPVCMGREMEASLPRTSGKHPFGKVGKPLMLKEYLSQRISEHSICLYCDPDVIATSSFDSLLGHITSEKVLFAGELYPTEVRQHCRNQLKRAWRDAGYPEVSMNGPEVNTGIILGYREPLLGLLETWSEFICARSSNVLHFDSDAEGSAWHDQDFFRYLWRWKLRDSIQVLDFFTIPTTVPPTHRLISVEQDKEYSDLLTIRFPGCADEPAICHFAGGSWRMFPEVFNYYGMPARAEECMC